MDSESSNVEEKIAGISLADGSKDTEDSVEDDSNTNECSKGNVMEENNSDTGVNEEGNSGSSIKEEGDSGSSVKEEPNVTGEHEDKENRSMAEDELKEQFFSLVKKSRQLAERGEISRALRLNRKALAIHHSDKLEKRIKKMEAFLAEQEDSDDYDEPNNEDIYDLGNGFKLHCTLARKLYTHQKEGVLWMWSLFRKGKGGILADDMGLGKTIQMIAFLAGMFDMEKIKTVMIVVPLSLMPVWGSEFTKWTPGLTVAEFHGCSKKDRERSLHRVRSRGGVLLTTYGLAVTQKDTLATRFGREFVWDYVVLDEGHKIKNPTKTSKSINGIPANNRIILTGTPVQNNLKELWSLFDYVHQGSLLGTVRTFKMQFETPITKARERDASVVEKRLGQEMSDALKSIIQPYFLRRTKKDVNAQKEETQDENCAVMPELTRKNDIVLWVHLTEAQQKIYEDFINLDEVKALLMTKKSPLVALTVLKKVCDHPRLLSTRACMKLGLDGDDFDEEDLEKSGCMESAVTKIDMIPDEVLVGESGKMDILVGLLDNFKAEGHKTLVFSYSRKLLDIIQKVMENKGHKLARLDGTISSLAERKDIVERFQKDPSYSGFLLTSQVGGVGLTITAADRVIIYDPSWNPANDAQAVDRAYRIGQTENVVVHRMITCGTVEEKIYRRQVFKDSITRQTTGNTKNPYRYFTKMELKELFTLDDPMSSKTQQQLQEMHSRQRVTDESLDRHIAFLHSLNIFGISDHDLMFNDIHVRDDEDDEEPIYVGRQENVNNEQFIQFKIQRAQQMIAEESNNLMSYEERSKGGMKYPTVPRNGQDEPLPPPPPRSLFSYVGSDPAEDNPPLQLSDEDDDVVVAQGPVASPVTVESIYIDDSDPEEEKEVKPNIKREPEQDFRRSLQEMKHETEVKPNIKREPEQDFRRSLQEMKHNLDRESQGMDRMNKPSIKTESPDQTSSGSGVDSELDIYDDDVKAASALKSDESADQEEILSDSSEEELSRKKKPMVSLSTLRIELSPSQVQRRAFQPLSEDDLIKRSPMIPALMDGSEVVSEEIHISLLEDRPLVGLELSASKGPRGTPKLSAHSDNAPSRVLSFSPLKGSPTNSGSNSPVAVTSQSSSSKKNAHRALFQTSSTPCDRLGSSPKGSKPLVDDSPDLVEENQSPANVSGNLSLNSSRARRSLSFGLDAKTDNSSKSQKGSSQITIEESILVSDSDSDDSQAFVTGQEDSDAQEEEVAEASEEDEDIDDEDNNRFQSLVEQARNLYQRKEYQESLRYVEEALTIFQPPDLEKMAERIKKRISEAE